MTIIKAFKANGSLVFYTGKSCKAQYLEPMILRNSIIKNNFKVDNAVKTTIIYMFDPIYSYDWLMVIE